MLSGAPGCGFMTRPISLPLYLQVSVRLEWEESVDITVAQPNKYRRESLPSPPLRSALILRRAKRPAPRTVAEHHELTSQATLTHVNLHIPVDAPQELSTELGACVSEAPSQARIAHVCSQRR